MARTVVGLFDDLAQAQNIVEELIQAGFAREEISLVARNEAEELETETSTDVVNDAVAAGAGQGATVGSVVGGTLGLLIGLGAIVIPGVGPVIAAGSIAAALGTAAVGAGVGAAAGGLAGGLTSVGVQPSDVAYYTEGIRQGGVLVAVNAEDDREVEAAQTIVHRHGGQDVRRRMAVETQQAENVDEVSLTLPAPDSLASPTPPTPEENFEEKAKERLV